MKKIIYTPEDNMNVPIKIWADNVEDGAIKQLINLSKLPFIFKHVAAMPDCHQGYGMPIGGVMATNKVIIPNAVGVDIGCGMCAVKTSLTVKDLDIETLKTIISKIRDVIPVGFNHHTEQQKENSMPLFNTLLPFIAREKIDEMKIVAQEFKSALTQIGTLGGGNHFIEIQKDTEDNVWIMIHSGSRNLGYKVAKYYNDIAKKLNKRWHSEVPEEWELAFLPIETKEAYDYLQEMNYCVEFALANRYLMMDRIVEVLTEITEKSLFNKNDTLINIAHNYARFEHHFGKDVIVHRKGATSAKLGEIGIIPGSQGTKSYIVRGLGNKESFESCSHGAGRKMGRKAACKNLNLEEEIQRLDKQNIVHGIRTVNDLDEASGAYKDITTVMQNQNDLVEILVELTPLAVVKG